VEKYALSEDPKLGDGDRPLINKGNLPVLPGRQWKFYIYLRLPGEP
jgi:hypothetical protein